MPCELFRGLFFRCVLRKVCILVVSFTRIYHPQKIPYGKNPSLLRKNLKNIRVLPVAVSVESIYF
jgi:hypothetical protein